MFTFHGLGLTERGSCWRLKRALALITCLKDLIEPIHFEKKNLVLDQCWHADELCSGVARGTMIMVRACRIVVGAPTVQEELITDQTTETHPVLRLITFKAETSSSKV